MTAEASGNDLVQVVALLAAGVVAVPIFKRLGRFAPRAIIAEPLLRRRVLGR
jgi:hypothetical protein